MNFDVLQKINEIFPNDKFKIDINDTTNTVTIRSIITPTSSCLILIISKDHIIVSSLTKCNITESEGTGTSLMLKVELLAKKIGIGSIRIYDDSKIRVCGNEIDLFHFTIIMKGISWYNSLGYKSEIYDEEIKHNKHIISSRISDIAKRVGLDISRFQSISDDETVQQYITRFFNLIQQREPQCDQIHKDNGEYVKTIIKKISQLFLYERMLKKIISQGAGRRKQRTKNKNPNKKKRTRKNK